MPKSYSEGQINHEVTRRQQPKQRIHLNIAWKLENGIEVFDFPPSQSPDAKSIENPISVWVLIKLKNLKLLQCPVHIMILLSRDCTEKLASMMPSWTTKETGYLVK